MKWLRHGKLVNEDINRQNDLQESLFNLILVATESGNYHNVKWFPTWESCASNFII